MLRTLNFNSNQSPWSIVKYFFTDIKRYKCRKYGILETREKGTFADVSRSERFHKIVPLPYYNL